MNVADLPTALASKIEVDANGCWMLVQWRTSAQVPVGLPFWSGQQTPGGYGLTSRDGRKTCAHRVIYELLVGPIPDGLELDHRCRVRLCQNPAHLEPVTHLENVRRGERATATHCPRGHPYDLLNTYWYRDKRYCVACRHRISMRRNPANHLAYP